MHAHQASNQWLTKNDFLNAKNLKNSGPQFAHRNSITRPTTESPLLSNSALAAATRKEDKFKNNLLAKIPINSTIVGSSTSILSSSQMSRSSEQDKKTKFPTDIGLNNSFHESISSNDLMASTISPMQTTASSVRALVKNVYNKAVDSFTLSDHCKGFLKDMAIADSNGGWPVFGVYCVRWRRSCSTEENESKFVIQGIGM